MADEGQASWPLRLARAAVIAAVMCVLAVIAYRLIFVTFHPQDDDGYVLVSLRLFTGGQSLYTDVYSQYGPGLYAFVGWGAHLLGIPLTSDGARFINLAFWLASVLIAGLVVLRLSRQLLVCVAGMLVTFLALLADADEPIHPGALLALLLIAIIALAVLTFDRWPKLTMAGIGGLVAALITIKVNVGLFAACSTAFACAFATTALPAQRWVRAACAAVLFAVPWVLMAGHLDDGNTLRLALVLSSGAIGLTLVARAAAPDVIGRRAIASMVYGFAVVLVFVILAVLLGGTSPGDLIDGWFIRPAGTPDVQFSAIGVKPGNLAFALAGPIAAVFFLRRWPTGFSPDTWLGAVARFGFGLLIWLSLISPILGLPPYFTLTTNFAMPFAWVAALPREKDAQWMRFTRLLVPALAILAVLHGYPVATNQVAWGQVPLIFVGAICVSDGIAIARAVAGSRELWARVGATALVAGGILWVCLTPLKRESDNAALAWRLFRPLDLPGAERLKVDEQTYETFHALTEAIDRHCSTFITLPGLNSLYLFTEKEVPTVLSGPWTLFFKDDDQQKIVDEVKDDPQMCLVSNPQIETFWTLGRTPDRPLVAWMKQNFRVVEQFGFYQVSVRSERDENGDPPALGLASEVGQY